MANTTDLANDPTSTAADFPRRFIAAGDNLDDWSRIEPYFDKLRDRDIKDADQLVRWLEDFSELMACVLEVGTDRHVRMTCQTDDPDRKRAFLDFIENIEPKCKPRTFELEVKVAFAPTTVPEKLKLHPGATATFRLLANRLAPFNGKLTIQPSRTEGIELDEELVIDAGQDGIDVTIAVAAEIKPGSYKFKLPAETRIGKFFESGAGNSLEIVVQEKPAAPTEGSE